MPKNFTGIISGPQDPKATTERYFGTATDVAGNVAQIAQVAGGMQDKRILSQYENDLLANTPDTKAYDASLRDIKQKLYDASSNNDKAAMTEYMGKLEQLRRGEMSGIMSPTASNLRMQMLTKEWANRYPHLTEEFKKVYNSAGSSGYGGTSQTEDPVQKGMDEVLQESFRTGKSVAAIWEQKRLADDVANLENRIKMKQLQGEEIKPELERMFAATTRAALLEIPNALRLESAAGNLDGNNWANQLTAARDTLAAKYREMFYDQERAGYRFTHEYKTQVINEQLAMYDRWITVAKNADSSDNAARLAKNSQSIVEAGYEQYLFDTFGYGGYMMFKTPNALDIVGAAVEAQRAMSGGGGRQALWEALAETNPKAAAVAALVTDGTLAKLTIQNLGFALAQSNGVNTGTPDAVDPLGAVTPEVRRLVVGSLERFIQQPGFDKEDYASMVVRMAAEIPDKLAKNKTALAYMQSIPGLRDKVSQVLANTMVGLANDMDAWEFDLIEMSGAGQAGPQVRSKDPQAEAEAGMMAGTGSEAAAFAYPAMATDKSVNVNNMAALLNAYYESLVGSGVDPTEARTAVARGLSSVIQMRTEEGQRPTRAQAAEAENQKLVDAKKSENDLEAATTMILNAVQEKKLPAKMASEFLKVFNGVNSTALEALSPGIYRDKKTGGLYKITEGGLISSVQ